MKDLISRQAAIKVMRKAKDKSELHRMLVQLPSAQPESFEDERKKIADALSDKMAYMNTCLNERDIILGIVGVKRPSENHCNSDCWNEKCESYHYATKTLPSAQSEYVHGRNINVDELIKILNPESNYVFYDDAHGFCINTQDVLDHLCAMPSTQSEQRNARVFQGIVVEYPSISVYPEYEGKPYFSIKYTVNGQKFIGYGTYKPEVLSEFLKEYFMPPTQPWWIPCSTALPEHDGEYLVTKKSFGWNCKEYIETDIARYEKKDGWHKADTVLAWCELPTPYREGGHGNGLD